ncbi:MAG: hypothetical protein L0338_29440 [Acidobacteria bacterium]|nr:hypothetical protein [Acidobacteriota bacterium]
MRLITVGILSLLLCGGACALALVYAGFSGTPLPENQAAESSVLGRVLTDRRLWGDDAFRLFGSLDMWSEAGESTISIYPDRVSGGTPFEAAAAAEAGASRINALVKRARPKLRPEFSAQYREALARPSAFRAQVARFLEDDSYRVVWQPPAGEFLKKDVKVRSVLDAYGQPEKTTTEVVHSQGDRRPAVLTVHHYANGAVRFVESDLAPFPGIVDRVVLDVRAAGAQVFVSFR